MQQLKLTVLICTHNGERTLQQALEAIANQTDIPRDWFEVLVIDNASSDRTSEIATAALQNFGLNGRVLHEPRAGKINAFLTGVKVAQSELISIIDDDNFIEPGFIRCTLEVFEQHPCVGITGSKNTICVAQPVPDWFSWVPGRYACSQPMLEDIEAKHLNGLIIARNGFLAGAGATFRVKPLLECIASGYQFFNNCERGSKMKGGCEDLEVFQLIRSLGYRFAFDPRIQVRHAVKADRLNLDYLKRLSRSQGEGSPGIDPFLFTDPHQSARFSLRWTWQWQLLTKIKRYLRLLWIGLKAKDERLRFRNWVEQEECIGTIQRILEERSRYTEHIRQVAAGEWTQLRVR